MSMYAVVETGGKQYRVSAGDKLEVELLAVEAGKPVTFDRVLLVNLDGKVSVGANRLTRLFKPEVVEPVRLHVTAKRYLCWKEKSYLEGLSPASLQSLHLQGGPMTDDEAREFERHPHYDAAVRLRRYDDMGKVPDMMTPDFEAFRPVLEPFVKA